MSEVKLVRVAKNRWNVISGNVIEFAAHVKDNGAAWEVALFTQGCGRSSACFPTEKKAVYFAQRWLAGQMFTLVDYT